MNSRRSGEPIRMHKLEPIRKNGIVLILLLAIAVLTVGCRPQVVEVEVTAVPQVNVVEVTATPTPPPAGHGGLIAFLSDRAASTYELYVMNADGTGPRVLATAGDGFCAGPSWSPDGQRIAYTQVLPDERGVLDNHGPFEIWVTALDGSESILLSADITDEILALPWPTPTWSPDGTRLAFIAARETDAGDTLSTVYVVAADGGGLEWSYPLPWLAFDVFWSPAGDALLLVGYDEEIGPSVHTLSIADRELIEIHQNAQAAGWSPDGSQIVVSPVQPPDVIVLEPGGESRVVARIEDKFPLTARWSPDGENILVGTSHSSNLMKITALHLVSLDTGELTTIAEYDDKYIYQPNWSPGGDRLLYTTTDLNRRRQGNIPYADLWVYTLTSGETQQLTTGEFHDGMGVWSPDSTSTLPAVPASSSRPASLSLTRARQYFGPARTFQIGLGDLDNDGDLDAVFSNMGPNYSKVWFNDGSGYFEDSGQRLTQEGHGVAVGDLDGDGDLDLFITCAEYQKRSVIYLNEGGAQGGTPGNFQDTEQDLGSEDYELSATGVRLHDVDEDGDLDAFVVYYEAPDKIYLNDGTGNFTDSGLTCPDDNAVWGDLDLDGDVDVFAKELGTGYKVLLNDGAGNFTAHWQMEDSTVLYGGMALGDLDADGDLDIVISNGDRDGSYPMRVFMNDGGVQGGTLDQFTDSGQELGLTEWASVTLGDLNGDGHLDAFITNLGQPDRMWLNDGTGHFVDTGVELGGDATTRNAALGDLDDDGDLDVFVADFFGGSNHMWFIERSAPQELSQVVFTKSEQDLGDTRTFSLAIEDIDLDSDNDIFIANYVGPSRLWLNDGNGVFSQSSQRFSASEVHGVGIEDLNGDTWPDIFLVSHATPSKIYFNDGAGAFTDSGQSIGSAADAPGMVLLGDVDGDGDADAFISYSDAPNRLWLNDGNGFFTMTDTEYGGRGKSYKMALADFNGDTFPDLFLCMNDQADQVWMNDGLGNFVDSGQALGSESGDDHVASQDVDGDGDTDVVVANNVEGVKVWLNQDNTGVFVEAGPYFDAGVMRCELFDADLDGDFDLITTHLENGNKLWLNDGSGSFTYSGPLFGSDRALSIAYGKLDADDDYDVVLGKLEGTGGNAIYFNE